MCVDDQRINRSTKFNCFPFPRLDEALDVFARSKIFLSLDFYDNFVPSVSDVKQTAFIAHVVLIKMVTKLFNL